MDFFFLYETSDYKHVTRPRLKVSRLLSELGYADMPDFRVGVWEKYSEVGKVQIHKTAENHWAKYVVTAPDPNYPPMAFGIPEEALAAAEALIVCLRVAAGEK